MKSESQSISGQSSGIVSSNFDAIGNRTSAIIASEGRGSFIYGSANSPNRYTSTTNEAYHFHYDGNGNVSEITDHLGVSVATYRYDAFGNTLVATGTYAATNRYRFSTKPLDHEVTTAPLYYYGYRYLDPLTGRWLSKDPLGELSFKVTNSFYAPQEPPIESNSDMVNLYSLLGNNGVNSVDLMGLFELFGMPFPWRPWPGVPEKTKVALHLIKAVGIALVPQYKAALGRCHNTLEGCQQNCGWVSIEGAAALQVFFVDCKLKGLAYWPACYYALIQGSKKLEEWDRRCTEIGCKRKKCCWNDKEPSHFGDPTAFDYKYNDPPEE